MLSISVIVITKNESIHIKDCILCANLLTDDIIVVDSGSTDGTVEIARQAGALVKIVPWQGFGYARNCAASFAKYDWILAIDADERVTLELVEALKKISLNYSNTIYGFKRQNYFLGKKIKFGEWSKDKVFRLYNRSKVRWDSEPIHEVLIGDGIKKDILKGFINHFPVSNLAQNESKTQRYAQLNAEKFFQQGRKTTIIKRYLSPLFTFIKTYFILLGFLDGKEGFIIAKSISYYAYLKYKILHEMVKGNKV